MVASELELIKLLNEIEDRLDEIGEEYGKLSFQRFLDKKPNPRLIELEELRSQITLDPRLFSVVVEWAGRVNEPLLTRRLENWRNSLIGARVGANPEVQRMTRELGDALIAHKYCVKGELLDLGAIRGILRANPDSELRQAAFYSLAELSQALAERLKALIRLRNQLAKEQGYATYVDMTMHLNGMDTLQVEGILNELTNATDKVYHGLIAEGAGKLGISEVEPWDVQYILEQGGQIDKAKFPVSKITESLEEYMNSMGHTLKGLNITPHIIDIPYNGLCMSINRQDIRILFNPQDGFAYYKTAFHELGHALHSALNRQKHNSLRRESSIFTEGIAEIFGYIPQHPQWLRKMGLSEDEIAVAHRSLLGPLFHYIRQRTAYCLFEHAMYRNPEQDLDSLLGEVEAKVLGCAANNHPRWASNAWYINYPVYWHNYVLADVIASQVHEHLERRVGELYNSKQAFEYCIASYIAEGGAIPWLEKIRKGTGHELSAKALIRDLTR